LGYERNFIIFDVDDQKIVVKECIAELNLDPKNYDVNSVRSIISNEKNSRKSAETYLKENFNEFRLRKIGEIFELYDKKLKKSNALDFDDLIVKTLDLLEQYEDIREYYRNKFNYILVDEYQDTNKVQYMLIKLLGKRKNGLENVFVVGDEDQSIYGWRGADINNILDFERDFPSAKVIKLERNYRSSQNILDAANSVIVNNTQRIGKNLWTEDNKGDKIQLYQANSEKTEALHIAERIYNEKNIHRTSYSGTGENQSTNESD
jgi:DNA helicase-2/ATP-dependent DNA helicase PcrA